MASHYLDRFCSRKIAVHEVTEEEVEQVVFSARQTGRSRTTGRPIYIGVTRAGRRLVVVFERLDATTIEIITAYEPTRS